MCVYFAAAKQHSVAGATDNSQPMSDTNNGQAIGHDHDYCNLGSSVNTNDISLYAELDINRQRAPVYEQLKIQHSL